MGRVKRLTLDERVSELEKLYDFFFGDFDNIRDDLVRNGSLSSMYYNKLYVALVQRYFSDILKVDASYSSWLLDDSFYLNLDSLDRYSDLLRASEDLDADYYDTMESVLSFVDSSTRKFCPYHSLITVASTECNCLFQVGAGLDEDAEAYERYEYSDLTEDEVKAGYKNLADALIEDLLRTSGKKFPNRKRLQNFMEEVASTASPDIFEYDLGVCVHYSELWGYFLNWKEKNEKNLSEDEKKETNKLKNIMNYVCPWLRFNYVGEVTMQNSKLYGYAYGITDYDATGIYDAAYFFAVFANYADLLLFKLNEKYSFLPKKYKNGWKKIFPDMVKTEQNIFCSAKQLKKAV